MKSGALVLLVLLSACKVSNQTQLNKKQSGEVLSSAPSSGQCWNIVELIKTRKLPKPHQDWKLIDGFYAFSRESLKKDSKSKLAALKFVPSRSGLFEIAVFGKRVKGQAKCPKNAPNDQCNDVWLSVKGPGIPGKSIKTMVKPPWGETKWDFQHEPHHVDKPIPNIIKLQKGKTYSLSVTGRSIGTQIRALQVVLKDRKYENCGGQPSVKSNRGK